MGELLVDKSEGKVVLTLDLSDKFKYQTSIGQLRAQTVTLPASVAENEQLYVY